MPRSQKPAAVLYVYSTNSPFEELVNQYMSRGLPIMPYTGYGDVLGNQSSPVNSQSLPSFSDVPPVSQEEITILD